jgi:hypothetical protein
MLRLLLALSVAPKSCLRCSISSLFLFTRGEPAPCVAEHGHASSGMQMQAWQGKDITEIKSYPFPPANDFYSGLKSPESFSAPAISASAFFVFLSVLCKEQGAKSTAYFGRHMHGRLFVSLT